MTPNSKLSNLPLPPPHIRLHLKLKSFKCSTDFLCPVEKFCSQAVSKQLMNSEPIQYMRTTTPTFMRCKTAGLKLPNHQLKTPTCCVSLPWISVAMSKTTSSFLSNLSVYPGGTVHSCQIPARVRCRKCQSAIKALLPGSFSC